MPDLPVRHFQGGDGTKPAYREAGQGRPLVLLHGYFSNAIVNWARCSHAARIAARGPCVIMPDLRGPGGSGKPHEPAAYPPDALADDSFALARHLGLTSYSPRGYPLGGQTVVRMRPPVACGGSASPR